MTAIDIKTQSLVDILLSYKDLCQEIEYFELLLSETEQEYKYNRKVMIGKPGKGTVLSVDRMYDNMKIILDRYSKYEKLLEMKKKLKTQAEELIKRFEGIEYQVAYKRFVEKKKLEEIAEELHYSIDGIKKISSRITKALEGH